VVVLLGRGRCSICKSIKLKNNLLLKGRMEKGDWKIVVILAIVLLLAVLLAVNLGRLFSTPVATDVVRQVVNAT